MTSGRTPTQPAARRLPALSDRSIANLFLLPTILLLVAMNVFPLVWSLYLAFCRYSTISNNGPVWVGAANFSALLSDPSAHQKFTVTATFTLCAVGIEMVAGFCLALLLHRSFRAKALVTTLLLLPMMLSPVVVGLFWRLMFDSTTGLVNFLLQLVHLQNPLHPISWLGRPGYAMAALVITDAWMWTPFVMLISLAGLSAVPPHLYEAAEVDRASVWFKFRHITLPMTAPLLMVALLFRTMDCFKLFDTVFVLTSGGPGSTTETVSYSLYKQAFQFHNTGAACALAYVILLVIIGLSNIYMKWLAHIRGEGTADDTSLWSAAARRIAGGPRLRRILQRPDAFAAIAAILLVLDLGGGRWLMQNAAAAVWCVGAVAATAAVVWIGQMLLARAPVLVRSVVLNVLLLGALAAFLLPIYWITVTSLKPPVLIDSLTPRFIFHPTLSNYSSLIFQHVNDDPSARITGLSDFPGKLFNSLLIGLAATALALLLGTTAAYALARFRIKAKSDALFFILSTRMLPPIVVVIPIFLMYRFLGLLDTRLGLVILYTMTNVSFAAYLMKGFFDDIPHEYDDAALLDGCSRLQAFRRVSLPQATTGMAATAVFCFITAWNEFAFAQLLATGEPLTAPPYIVSRTGSGGIDWGPIAAGALIFLIPAALFTFLMRRHLLRGVTFGAIKR